MLDELPNDEDGSSYRVTLALVRLELCAGKLACTVLRGLGTGNRPRLLGINWKLQRQIIPACVLITPSSTPAEPKGFLSIIICLMFGGLHVEFCLV